MPDLQNQRPKSKRQLLEEERQRKEQQRMVELGNLEREVARKQRIIDNSSFYDLVGHILLALAAIILASAIILAVSDYDRDRVIWAMILGFFVLVASVTFQIIPECAKEDIKKLRKKRLAFFEQKNRH